MDFIMYLKQRNIFILLFISLWASIPIWIKEDFFIKIKSILGFNFYTLSCTTKIDSFCILIYKMIILFEELFFMKFSTSLFISIIYLYLMHRVYEEYKNISSLNILILFIIFSIFFIDQKSLLFSWDFLDYSLFSILILCLYRGYNIFIPIISIILFLSKPWYIFIILPFLGFYIFQPNKFFKKFAPILIFVSVFLLWVVVFSGTLDNNFIYICYRYIFNKNMSLYHDSSIFSPLLICFSFIILKNKILNSKDITIMISTLQYLFTKVYYF